MASAFENGEKVIANSTVGGTGGTVRQPLSSESDSSPAGVWVISGRSWAIAVDLVVVGVM